METDAREWRSKLLKDYRVRMDAAEQSASALRQERDALRAELAEWGDWKNGAVIGDDPDSGSLEQLREWVKAEKTKCAAEGSVFDTGFRCVSEGGTLFEFDPESVAALFDRAEKAEADASALRASLAAAQRELAALRVTFAPLSTEGAQQQTKGAK